MEAPAAPCPVVVDTDRFDQSLTNLLENATKYSPNGGAIGVTLRAAADPETRREGLIPSVRDEGIGLPADLLELTFEPFGRAANAAHRQIAGLGLGLYICRDIVQRHGGRIWAESPGDERRATSDERRIGVVDD